MYSATLYLSGAAFVALVLFWMRQRSSKKNKLPPGPFSFPIIGPVNTGGMIPEDQKACKGETPRYQIYQEWGREFGDVYSFRMGGRLFIVLNSFDAIREAWLVQGDATAARPSLPFATLLNPRKLGLLVSEGDLWREQRRFALHTLRDMGFGREGAESAIQEELQALIKDIQEADGAHTAFDPQFVYSRAVANVICMLVFNERLAEEPEFRELNSIINGEIVSRISPSRNIFVILLANILIKLPGDFFGIKSVIKARATVLDYVVRKMREHEATFDESRIRDYIDAFIQEMRIRSKGSQKHYFTPEQLGESLASLFTAGQETTATALRWATLFMAHHPEVQKRVQQEIDEKVGKDGRAIGYADRSLMPYTEGVINEVLRFGSIIPQTGHRVLTPFTLRGYEVPVGAITFGNIYGTLHDPRTWPAPNKFDPDTNFPLGADGSSERTQLIQSQVAFGLGKRSCLGESLAKQELFIFFTGLLRHFQIKPDPNWPLPPEHLGTNGITRAPLSYRALFIERN